MSERRPVLVVVDVQNGFITEDSAPVVPVIVELVRRWQGLGGEVVFTRYLNYAGSPYERLIGWTEMTHAPDTDLVPELASHVGHSPVVDKRIYSLFTPEGTQLVDEHRWTDLYICGIDTDSCVLKTAVDAFERGDLTPWIVEDACASHAGPEPHNAGLLVARRFIGRSQIISVAGLPEAVLPVPA